MSDEVAPHVRYCLGCGVYDDAPRAQGIADVNGEWKLYHHQPECCPPDVYEGLHPAVRAAVEAGQKDDVLREQILATREG